MIGTKANQTTALDWKTDQGQFFANTAANFDRWEETVGLEPGVELAA